MQPGNNQAKSSILSSEMPFLVLFLFATCLSSAWLMDQKALDEFVNLPDHYYNYTLMKKTVVPSLFRGMLVHFHTLNLTSQKWLDESEVDKPIWSHKLTIAVIPKKIHTNTCLLLIRPDKKEEDIKDSLRKTLGTQVFVIKLKSVVAVLDPLPIQPLTFYDHPLGLKNITGNDILAYSWWKFLNGPTVPPHWLVLFPMVKAIVRAMDTIVTYIKKQYHKEITNFMLTGNSTYGWTAWLTAAVDQRVKGIIPIAMDFLNFTESFHHQYRAYCGWSYMLRPWYEMNITRKLDTPRFQELTSHLDPLAYNERYTNVAKYIIILSGDEFFQPDNTRYYFSQLKGVKYLQIVPNTDYGFKAEYVFSGQIASFCLKLLDKKYGLPEVSWEIKMTNTSAAIILRTYNVYRVYSYHAGTVDGTRRDFRMRIAAGNSSKDNPVKWIRTEVQTVERDVYKKEMEIPEKRWRAFFIEAIYALDSTGGNLIVTSEMVVMPDSFPCPDCNGEGCRGKLV